VIAREEGSPAPDAKVDQPLRKPDWVETTITSRAEVMAPVRGRSGSDKGRRAGKDGLTDRTVRTPTVENRSCGRDAKKNASAYQRAR